MARCRCRHLLGRGRKLGLLLLGAALVLTVGCVSGQKKSAGEPIPQQGPVEELHLLAIPVALNFDQVPGVDGFAVKVYAGSSQVPKSVRIPDGTLEILMFDGLLSGTDFAATPPLRIWTYPAAALKKFEIVTSIGTGYQLTPQWGEAKPTRDKITVVARYTSAGGVTIYSAPSSISAAVR